MVDLKKALYYVPLVDNKMWDKVTCPRVPLEKNGKRGGFKKGIILNGVSE